MFGFRPEPINIPVVTSSPSLEVPGQPLTAKGAGAGLSLSISSFDGGGGVCACCDDAAAASSSAAGVAAHHSAAADAAAAAASLAAAAAASLAADASDPIALALANSDIRPEHLQVLHNIGHGSSGVVQKVLHTPSDSVLALKIIPVEADEAKRKAILLELKTLHESMHPSIVSFYGAFFREGAVHIALEYMDASLLDVMRAAGQPLPEPLLASIASTVLQGLVYLHRERHTIHRDVKPANLLVDGSSGAIKIADFGVSGELGHSLSKCASWVGTVHYMSPERISGNKYAFDSDVWSLGITMLELATGAFPYPPERDGKRLSFWDLLDAIVESPPPVPPPHFSPPFHNFITACLQKAPEQRPSSTALLQHPMLSAHAAGKAEADGWLRAALSKLPPRGDGGAANGGDGEPPWLGGGETLPHGASPMLGGDGEADAMDTETEARPPWL